MFQKELKGAIYECWLAILQQFDFDIVYKPAAQMVWPKVFSRNSYYPEHLESSPVEEDPFIPYVSEPVKTIRYATNNKVMQYLVNRLDILRHDHLDDAHIEDNIPVVPGNKVSKHKKLLYQSKRRVIVSNKTVVDNEITCTMSSVNDEDSVVL